MKISVVIPLYNKKDFVHRALESVLAQTRPADEIILVDDGSTDGGGEAIRDLMQSRLRLIRQENRGASAARNRGVAEAKGEFIAFLDADDAWKPRFLEIVYRLSKRFPQAGAYATDYEVISWLGRKVRLKRLILPEGAEAGLINYFKVGSHSPVHSSSVMVPKKTLAEVGGFPEGEPIFEDFDTWLRIALSYPIAWASEIGSTVFQNAGNHTWDRVRLAAEPVVSRTARRALQRGMVAPDKLEDVREYAAFVQISAARNFLLNRNKPMAVAMLNYARGTREYKRWWWKIAILAVLPGNSGPWILKKHESTNLKSTLEPLGL